MSGSANPRKMNGDGKTEKLEKAIEHVMFRAMEDLLHVFGSDGPAVLHKATFEAMTNVPPSPTVTKTNTAPTVTKTNTAWVSKMDDLLSPTISMPKKDVKDVFGINESDPRTDTTLNQKLRAARKLLSS